MIYVLVWINGALIGAFWMAITIYWALASGKRTVRPLNNLFVPDPPETTRTS